jgi:hypothetical protein
MAMMMLGLYAALIFLSAMGHLVPRYWTVLEVMLLMLLCMALSEHRSLWMKRCFGAWVCVAILWNADPLKKLFQAAGDPRQIHSVEVPLSLKQKLHSAQWVACDHPAMLIDAIQKPILLLPNTVEQVHAISEEVEPIEVIVLTPNLHKGELATWMDQQAELQQLGYQKVIDPSGWVLWKWAKP